VAEARGFGNSEEREYSPLDANARGLVKTQKKKTELLRGMVNC
jgi:hypothetical protein